MKTGKEIHLEITEAMQRVGQLKQAISHQRNVMGSDNHAVKVLQTELTDAEAYFKRLESTDYTDTALAKKLVQEVDHEPVACAADDRHDHEQRQWELRQRFSHLCEYLRLENIPKPFRDEANEQLHAILIEWAGKSHE